MTTLLNVSSPTYPILEYIMGQRNETMENHGNNICSSPSISPSGEEDTLML